jgi:PHD/YefM family antitoxin component YafN of YafNO toxin-antitoxin module
MVRLKSRAEKELAGLAEERCVPVEQDAVMIDVHPSYIERNGQTEFVVLPVEEFRLLQEHIEDMEDLLELRKAKAEKGDAGTVSLEEFTRTAG